LRSSSFKLPLKGPFQSVSDYLHRATEVLESGLELIKSEKSDDDHCACLKRDLGRIWEKFRELIFIILGLFFRTTWTHTHTELDIHGEFILMRPNSTLIDAIIVDQEAMKLNAFIFRLREVDNKVLGKTQGPFEVFLHSIHSLDTKLG
jgi:hypothetical protein